jgi:site-specific recombinase XerC
MAADGTTKRTGTQRVGYAGLRATDAYLLKEWTEALRDEGWSQPSIERDLRRLRALDRASTHGLCNADRTDVVSFATQRGQAAGLAVDALIRTEAWRLDVRAIRRFFRWAKTQYTGVASDPTVGLRLPPSHSRGPRIRARDGHLYERVLAAPELSVRDRAIVWLLAHGLTPAEVAALHIRSADFGSNEVVVGSRAPRFVPLTETAAGYVAEWLLARGASEGESMFLGITPSPSRGRHTAAEMSSSETLNVHAVQEWSRIPPTQ